MLAPVERESGKETMDFCANPKYNSNVEKGRLARSLSAAEVE